MFITAAILDLPLPVTSYSIYSINDLLSRLSDLENIEVDIGNSTIHSMRAFMKYEVYFRFSCHHLRFITSGYFRQRLQFELYIFSELSDLEKYIGDHWSFDGT